MSKVIIAEEEEYKEECEWCGNYGNTWKITYPTNDIVRRCYDCMRQAKGATIFPWRIYTLEDKFKQLPDDARRRKVELKSSET
jgi:hypothetical protein